MGIKAVHVFRLEPRDGGTLVRSEESWDGVVARVLKSYSRRTIESAITNVLGHLKTEAERRAAACVTETRSGAVVTARVSRRSGYASQGSRSGFAHHRPPVASRRMPSDGSSTRTGGLSAQPQSYDRVAAGVRRGTVLERSWIHRARRTVNVAAVVSTPSCPTASTRLSSAGCNVAACSRRVPRKDSDQRACGPTCASLLRRRAGPPSIDPPRCRTPIDSAVPGGQRAVVERDSYPFPMGGNVGTTPMSPITRIVRVEPSVAECRDSSDSASRHCDQPVGSVRRLEVRGEHIAAAFRSRCARACCLGPLDGVEARSRSLDRHRRDRMPSPASQGQCRGRLASAPPIRTIRLPRQARSRLATP